MATILPTGETQFLDGNGDPLAGGSVTFYIPGTTSPKDTWQNSGQSILNSNPVTLDAAGRAIIYGSGAYRQVVKDSVGNLIWDQSTAEPNSGNVSFGGTSSGTNNAQILTAAQFSGIDGQIVSFVAGLSNSGPMTISLGGSSPIPIVKNGPTGPVALASGDIVAGNSYFIQYSTTLASFQLLLSVAPALPTGEFLRGYIYGLILTRNGADLVNDINFGAGSAGSDGVTPALMTLSATLTKRIDAPWSVGNNQGGLDTGTAADGVYYTWEIQRSDSGVTDGLISLSNTAPTMPASYDRKRLVGSFSRISGTNNEPRSYSQVGPTDWLEYLPIFTGVTVSQLSARSRRVGASLEVEAYFVTVTANAAIFAMTIGYGGTSGSIVLDAYWNAKRPLLGNAITNVNAANIYLLGIGGSAEINFGGSGAGANPFSLITGIALGSGTVVSVRFSLPIQGWQ
jgi:hypothetical protein